MSLYNAFRNEKKKKGNNNTTETLSKVSAHSSLFRVKQWSKSLGKHLLPIKVSSTSTDYYFFFFFINLKGHLIWFFILGAEQLKKHNKNKECKRSVKIRESKRAPLFFYFPLPCFIFYVFHVWMPEFRAWQVIVYFLSVIVYWLFYFILFF